MRITYCFFGLLGLSLCAYADVARASEISLAILSEAHGVGESVDLSDLLPTRDDLREIAVPPEIVVRRPGRLITREEVLAAIRSALHGKDLPGGPGLEPTDVHFSASLTVSAADAKLEVLRMDFDAALQQARFLLVSGADRRVLPFLVTARLRSTIPAHSSIGSAGDLQNGTQTSAEPISTKLVSAGRLGSGFSRLSLLGSAHLPQSDAVPLVEPGKLASLRIFSGTMQMLVDVAPLERGELGETVRVRIPGTAKVLQGRVVAHGRLEARF